MTDSPRFALHLADGTRVPLPQPPDLTEFALPGNGMQHRDFLSFFCPVSSTGALYYFETRTWHLLQPIGRAAFAAHCALLDSLAPSQDLAAMLAAGEAPSATKH